jgi:hypothetical protein
VDSKVQYNRDNNIANRSLDRQKKTMPLKRFCYNPFFKMALNFERKNVNFGCGCTTIDVSKCEYDEIWNCNALVKYRQSILNNDLSVCNL